MSEKHDLAVLYSMIDSPLTEFVESEPFKRLEMAPEVIRQVEPLGLPEVKRLICCSSILVEFEWAAKYSVARKYYVKETAIDVLALLMQYNNNVADYEKEILSCVDGSVLSKIDTFIKDTTAEKERAKKERAALKGKITKARNNQQELALQEESAGDINAAKGDATEAVVADRSASKIARPKIKSEDELRMEKLDKYIEERDRFIKIFAKHISKTQVYLKQINDAEMMNCQRQKAYKIIDDMKPPVEEEFLDRYIHEGVLSTEDEAALRNCDFLQRVTELLDKPIYRDRAFPVLSNLYTNGAIDLESDIIARYISAHGKLLAAYLEDKYTSTPDYLSDTENRVFVEYAIRETVAGNINYVSWWNTIRNAADWKTILDAAEEILDDSILKVAVKLLHQVDGVSLEAFWELIQSPQAEVIHITPADFIVERLAQEAPSQKKLVSDYVRGAEQNIRKLQRRVSVKEREISRHSQELFSALYQPLEQIEELAVNLRLSDGDIKCSLVAGHVINALADLREGLAALGLDAADEVDAWRKQSFVAYDPDKHRMSSSIGTAGEQVKLQTLGYAYIDDEGNQKVRAAEVYIPVSQDSQIEKDSDRNASASSAKNTTAAKPPKQRRKKVTEERKSPKKKGYPKTENTSAKPKKSSYRPKEKKK